jgi:hypothetical protein
MRRANQIRKEQPVKGGDADSKSRLLPKIADKVADKMTV